MTAKELEHAIDEILGIKRKAVPIVPKRKRGRQTKKKPPTWSLDFYNPEHNRTFALISMCIKEDFEQSIEQLALRLSAYKYVPPAECLEVLIELKNSGKLGYYDDNNKLFRTWNGEETGYGLENMCG